MSTGSPAEKDALTGIFKRLDMVPPRTLRLLLSAIEPVALGKFAMKACQATGRHRGGEGIDVGVG